MNKTLAKNLGKFIKNSEATTFKFEKEILIANSQNIALKLRQQPGWHKVWQKNFITDDKKLTLGISVVEPGGGGKPETVQNEFIDYILSGEGILTIEGLGDYKIKAGDFLHIEKGVKRGFLNNGSEPFVSIYGINAKPSYKEVKNE